MKKFKLTLLSLMTFATLAACGSAGTEDPPAVEDPTQETPGEETSTPGEGEAPALGGEEYDEDADQEPNPGESQDEEDENTDNDGGV